MSLTDRFEKYEDEYLEFDRINEKDLLNPDPFVCGLLKLQKINNTSFSSIGAEHDKMVIPIGNFQLTDDDIIYLQRCGFQWDEDISCLVFLT